MISHIASKSAGPGTRQNIDSFTQTTAAGLEQVGGATEGKAIITLNPAEPPIMMRNTIYTQVHKDTDVEEVRDSIAELEGEIRSYVTGYEITMAPEVKGQEDVAFDLEDTVILTTMLEVEGEGQYLPPYAGNLDIMTSAALGAGSGNAQMEVLVGVLEKAGYEISPDFFGVMEAAEDVLVPMITDDEMPELDNDSLLLGYAGVYSSFHRHTRRAGRQYDVDPREIVVELGKMEVVGGQEDLIADVASRLAGEREAAAGSGD